MASDAPAPSITFREAQERDAGRLGAFHVAAWREAYAGLLPAALLDDLSEDERAAMWRAALRDPDAATVFLAERGGGLAGFGACGDQRDPALRADGYDGEVGALYVRGSEQGQGIGRALLRLMARRLLDRGCHRISLWVLRENAGARRFYERLGATRLREKQGAHGVPTLGEVAYGWDDPGAFAR